MQEQMLELSKRKVYLEFQCDCDYCKNNIKTILILKELSINGQLFPSDLIFYILNLIIDSEFTQAKTIVTESQNIEREFDKVKGMLNKLYEKRDKGDKLIELTAFSIYYDDTKPSLFNVPQELIFETQTIMDRIHSDIIKYETERDLLSMKLTAVWNLKKYYETLYKRHDARLKIKNLNRFNLYLPLPLLPVKEGNEKDELQSQLIRRFYRGDIFISLANLSSYSEFIRDERMQDYREILDTKCCLYCHLYGHHVEICRSKHCHILCRDCKVNNCHLPLYDCSLPHCNICLTHEHSTFECQKGIVSRKNKKRYRKKNIYRKKIQ